MAGLGQLIGAVSSSGLGTAIRGAQTAYRVGSGVKGALDATKSTKELLDDALNEDNYLRYGTTEDYIKKLSSDAINVAGDIPVLGEAMTVLGTPLKMAMDGFVSDVLAPVFLDTEAERKAIERRMDWERYVAEDSLYKYGYVMTPAQWQEAKHQENIEKNKARTDAQSQKIEEDTKRAKELGYGSIREMTAGERQKNLEDMRAEAERLGYSSLGEYSRARQEMARKTRASKRPTTLGYQANVYNNPAPTLTSSAQAIYNTLGQEYVPITSQGGFGRPTAGGFRPPDISGISGRGSQVAPQYSGGIRFN
jgi:hypothetical protein